MEGFDYSQYEKFVNNLQIATDDFQTFLKKFLLEMAQRVVAKTKLKTPVDTGALRASWGIGSQHIELNSRIDSFGNDIITLDTEKSQIADISVVGNYLQVTIWNAMEYASYVELGHGAYKGRFMLTISIDEVQQQMPKRFEKQFQEFLKEKGVV